MPGIHSIQQTHYVREILKYTRFNSLLLFDLDNTLIEAKTALGSDQWFTKLYYEASCTIDNRALAFEMTIAIYHAIQDFIKAQQVEQVSIDLIKAFQDIGLPVIAITARDINMEETTLRQLQDNHLDFTKGGSFYTFKHVLGTPENSLNTAFFSNGILYCDGKNKGKCLDAFLNNNAIHPRHIIMIDDKLKHLEHVGEIAGTKNIDFHGFRYGFLDSKVQSLDWHETKIQLTLIKEKLHVNVHPYLEALNLLVSQEHLENAQIDYDNFYFKDEVTQESAKLTKPSLQRRHSLFECAPGTDTNKITEKNNFFCDLKLHCKF